MNNLDKNEGLTRHCGRNYGPKPVRPVSPPAQYIESDIESRLIDIERRLLKIERLQKG